MSPFLHLLLQHVLHNVLHSAAEETTCALDDITCMLSDSVSRLEYESLGHYLLRKQEILHPIPPYQPPTSFLIHFANPNNKYYDIYKYNLYTYFQGFLSPPERIFVTTIKPKSINSTIASKHDIFYFTNKGSNPEDELYRFTVTNDILMYIFDPVLNQQDPYYHKILKHKQFIEQYKQDTGRQWIHYYPRSKPKFHMWSVKQGIGHIHHIKTKQTLWKCVPNNFKREHEVLKCRDKGKMTLDIEVISDEPRIFVIENIISDIEAELIIKLAKDKLKPKSGLGRTNTWLSRTAHPILDSIYRRMADLLKINQKLLYENKNSENIQIVHYDIGEEYNSHYDFSNIGDFTSRFVTLLLYLNDLEDDMSGGQTWFHRANEDNGIMIHPGKGNGILFYNLLSDGNGDEKTLHKAVKLVKGEKWICNFWVWDPQRYKYQSFYDFL